MCVIVVMILIGSTFDVLRLGALCNFYVHKRAAGRRHANARNYKENFGIPHFVLAQPLPLGEKKMRKAAEMLCRNSATVLAE